MPCCCPLPIPLPLSPRYTSIPQKSRRRPWFVALKNTRKSSQVSTQCGSTYNSLYPTLFTVVASSGRGLWSYDLMAEYSYSSYYYYLLIYYYYYVLCDAAPTPAPTGASTTCTPSWSTHDNRNSIYGRRQIGVTTVDACRSACLDDPRCVGLDWNRAGPIYCWLHQDRLNGPYHTDGVTQHVLVTRCQAASGMTSSARLTNSSCGRDVKNNLPELWRYFCCYARYHCDQRV